MKNLESKIDKKIKQAAARLKKLRFKIAVSESCTGGMLGSMLTSLPGSSTYFTGGVIVYSNMLKEKFGISRRTLVRFGAVSAHTAREMAIAVKNNTGADIGIGITGIAGPGGGTLKKPVGLVYIALAAKNVERVKRLLLKGQRNMIRRQACERSLDMIIDHLTRELEH